MQPPRGVHQHGVLPLRLRHAQRVGEHGRGIGALGPAVEGDRRPLGPDLELLGGRGAEGVGRARAAPSGPRADQAAASLPMVVVLPAPLTPTTNTTHGRAENGAAARPAARASGRSRRAAAPASRPTPPRAISPLLARSSSSASRHRGQAEVGADERLLDGVERLGVERAAAARQVLERRLQHLARAGEPAAQAVEERH